MAIRAIAYKVVGVANVLTLDSGAGAGGTAGISVPKDGAQTLIAVTVVTTGQVGNWVVGQIGQTPIIQHYDYTLDTTEAAGGANAYKSTVKMQTIEINRKLKETEVFKMGIQCGATAKDIYGSYIYDDGQG